MDRSLLEINNNSGMFPFIHKNNVPFSILLVWLKLVVAYISKWMKEHGIYKFSDDFESVIHILEDKYSDYLYLRNSPYTQGSAFVEGWNELIDFTTTLVVSAFTERRYTYYQVGFIEYLGCDLGVTGVCSVLSRLSEIYDEEFMERLSAIDATNLYESLDNFFADILKRYDTSDDEQLEELHYLFGETREDLESELQHCNEYIQYLYTKYSNECLNGELYPDEIFEPVCRIIDYCEGYRHLDIYVGCEALDIYLDYREKHIDSIHDMFSEEDALLMEYLDKIRFFERNGDRFYYNRVNGKSLFHINNVIDENADFLNSGYPMEYISFTVGLILREIEFILDKAKEVFNFSYKRVYNDMDIFSMFSYKSMDEDNP